MSAKTIAVVIVFAAIIAALAYYLVVGNQSYGVSVKMLALGPTSGLYPYQIMGYRITINNTGSTPISNMTLGVYINSALYHTYYVTLPAGTGAVVNGTYVFQASGNISIQAVADSGQLLNIPDRASTKSGFSATVLPAGSSDIYLYVPRPA